MPRPPVRSWATAHDETLEQWGRLKLLKVQVSSGEDGSDTVLKARLLDRGVNVGVDERSSAS